MSKERLIPVSGKITKEQKQALIDEAASYRRRTCTHIAIILADWADNFIKTKKTKDEN